MKALTKKRIVDFEKMLLKIDTEQRLKRIENDQYNEQKNKKYVKKVNNDEKLYYKNK